MPSKNQTDSMGAGCEIEDMEMLRAIYGEANKRSVLKQMASLDANCRKFIAHSPFMVLSTASAEGKADVSPKGDAPGFVAVLDDNTLLLPDRPGNNRMDSFTNILENPNLAMIFFVPGMDETLRVNGRGRLTRDPELLAPLAFKGKQPVAGLIMDIDDVYLHCANALVRSRLWDPQAHIDRSMFPSMGQMLANQLQGESTGEGEHYNEESIH